MDFISIEYLIFLGGTAACIRVCPRRWRVPFLLVASYLFYFSYSPGLAMVKRPATGSVLLVATVLCYVTGLRLRALRGRQVASLLTCASVSTLIVLLAFFKLRPLLCATCNPIIPLGVSYYTFRLISYLLDVYWGKYEAVDNVLDFALYVAFFPQMTAGPIQRESSFLAQLPRIGEQPRVIEGLSRMALGFAKKSIVADNLSLFVTWSYSHLHSGSSLPSLVALYLFPVQLYADFSGLADIAIGSGLILGIEAPENFDAPFLSKSITEFWRRWHITLTSWIRDYVFTPVRMMTRDWGRIGLSLSLVINMLLIALWHGFTFGFLAYGLFQALFLVIEALSSFQRQGIFSAHKRLDRIATLWGPIYVFNVIAIGSVFFRAPSMRSVWDLCSGLGAGWQHVAIDFADLMAPPNHHAWVALPAFFLITLADAYRRRHGFRLPAAAPRTLRWSVYSGVTVMWILIALTLLSSEKGADPFVYALF